MNVQQKEPVGTLSFREIKTTEPAAKECAQMVREYSWGNDYPIDPWDEIKQADYLVGCFDDKELIGCASITRIASPDGIDTNKPWLGHAIVLPEYRRQGILGKMYQHRIGYLQKMNESIIFTCTDNPIMENFLTNQGWMLDRITKDESGSACKVFKLDLK